MGGWEWRKLFSASPANAVIRLIREIVVPGEYLGILARGLSGVLEKGIRRKKIFYGKGYDPSHPSEPFNSTLSEGSLLIYSSPVHTKEQEYEHEYEEEEEHQRIFFASVGGGRGLLKWLTRNYISPQTLFPLRLAFRNDGNYAAKKNREKGIFLIKRMVFLEKGKLSRTSSFLFLRANFELRGKMSQPFFSPAI